MRLIALAPVPNLTGFMTLRDMKPARPRLIPIINAARCTGCRKCAVKCPFGVITMGEHGATEPAPLNPVSP